MDLAATPPDVTFANILHCTQNTVLPPVPYTIPAKAAAFIGGSRFIQL
jgi:hypothetical protein